MAEDDDSFQRYACQSRTAAARWKNQLLLLWSLISSWKDFCDVVVSDTGHQPQRPLMCFQLKCPLE